MKVEKGHIKYRITAEVLRERSGLTRGLPIAGCTKRTKYNETKRKMKKRNERVCFE
jgi:hypothetical protein